MSWTQFHVLFSMLAITALARGTLQIRMSSPASGTASVCLRAFLKENNPHQECHLGNTTSTVSENQLLTFTVPIEHWTETFAMLVSFGQSGSDVKQLFAHQGKLRANDPWRTITLYAQSTHTPLNAELKLTCDEGFFGSRCARECVSKPSLHITCDSNGIAVCEQGWTGAMCSLPICSGGCGNGTCTAPGTCLCTDGFKGPKCNECVPAVGCVHGQCFEGRPFTCKCAHGWSGPLCDYDGEYCTRNSPCRNGGICRSHKTKLFQCECPDGYGGKRCEIPTKHVCATTRDICLNGGKCVFLGGVNYKCNCAPGFTGQHCQKQTTEHNCQTFGCENGGLCAANAGHVSCSCPHGFTGQKCEIPNKEIETTHKGALDALLPSMAINLATGFLLFILAVLIGCPILFARWKRLSSIQNSINQRKEDAKKINGIVYKAVPVPGSQDCKDVPLRKPSYDAEHTERYSVGPKSLPTGSPECIYAEISSCRVSPKSCPSPKSLPTVSQSIAFNMPN